MVTQNRPMGKSAGWDSFSAWILILRSEGGAADSCALAGDRDGTPSIPIDLETQCVHVILDAGRQAGHAEDRSGAAECVGGKIGVSCRHRLAPEGFLAGAPGSYAGTYRSTAISRACSRVLATS